MTINKAHIISQLQGEILALEGFKDTLSIKSGVGLGPIDVAFPNGSFPIGTVHEFLAAGLEDAAATHGFLNGLLAQLMAGGGVIFWIGAKRKIFPPALALFNVRPEKVIFIDLHTEKHIMWAIEEALKCPALTAVVSEVEGISFTASRRLQLAVEHSKVTGFMLCHNPGKLGNTASASRWKISSLPSHTVDDLPGVGFPQWRVQLLRVRNGRPGVWDVRLSGGSFVPALPYKAYDPDLTHADHSTPAIYALGGSAISTLDKSTPELDPTSDGIQKTG